MSRREDTPRNPLRRRLVGLAAAAGLAGLAACQPVTIGGGPSIDTNAPVPVALLVPRGSGRADEEALASGLENAARMAIADLQGVQIDLRVYGTAGDPNRAASVAQSAVNEGAKIILGPVYSGTTNAAGRAVAGRGINVLSFSNNADIAGGNVFVLGNLFGDIANRLAGYARSQGKRNVFLVAADTPAEAVGRAAVTSALQRTGTGPSGTVVFEASQQGVIAAIPQIAQQVRDTGSDAVFFTSTNDSALPFLTQLLPENGVRASEIQFIGLGRLDVPAAAVSTPGLQGAWFATPDPRLSNNFIARYTAAYGSGPHPFAGLAYDGVAAIGALVRAGQSDALSASGLTQPSGFVGVNGIFRLRRDGTNQRAFAVAQIQNSKVVVIDPAPRSFAAGSGF